MIKIKIWQLAAAVFVLGVIVVVVIKFNKPSDLSPKVEDLEGKIKLKELEVDSLLQVNDSLKTVSEQHFYLYRQSALKSEAIEKSYQKLKNKINESPKIETYSDAVRDSVWHSLYPER